jgi:hypothetical protein
MFVMQIAQALVRVYALGERSSSVTSRYLWQLPSSARQYSPAWQ